MQDQVLFSPINLKELTLTLEGSFEKLIQAALRKTVDERLISIDTVRDMFIPRPSKTTIATYTKKGLLRSYWMGGKLLYKYSEVIEDATKIKGSFNLKNK